MALIFVAGYVAMVRVPVAIASCREPPAEVGRASATQRQRRNQRAGGSGPSLLLRGSDRSRCRRAGHRPRRRRSDGHRCGQRQRRPDPVRGSQRQPERAAAARTALHPDRPARPDRQSGQPPRAMRGADLPRPGLHVGLPTDRPGVPPDGPAVGRRPRATSTSSPSWPTRSTGPSSFTKAFDSQESMNRLPNWYFLTGSVTQLQRVWNSYGVLVSTVGAGAMVAHSDLAFIIDGRGRERDALIDDPGPTQAFASSFSSLLLSRIDRHSSIREVPSSPAAGPTRRCLALLGRCDRSPGVRASLPPAPAPRRPHPLVSAVSTSSDSWVTLPMGDLSDPANTFWELFHAGPGSAALVSGHPAGCRRQRRPHRVRLRRRRLGRFRAERPPAFLPPCAERARAGASWVPGLLPGALAPLPDALAYDASSPGASPRPARGGRALSGPADLSSWTPLVTAATLNRVSPACDVDGLDGCRAAPQRGAVDRHWLPARWTRRPVHADSHHLAARRAHTGRQSARGSHHRAPRAVDGGDGRRCSSSRAGVIGGPSLHCGRAAAGPGRSRGR